MDVYRAHKSGVQSPHWLSGTNEAPNLLYTDKAAILHKGRTNPLSKNA